MRSRRVALRLTCAALALPYVAPVLAFAQDNAPPQPSLKRYPQPWIGFLVMFLLAAVVIAVSIFPSKRGHQD